MADGVTEQALSRLSHLPDNPENPATLIAAQKYYDVEFTGGSISNVVLTDVTVNGTATARNERVITAAGNVTVASDDYVVTMNKTVSQITTITLPATPTTSRSIIVKDGKGDAASFNITISGNGKTIDGSATFVVNDNYGSVEIIYNGTEWNAIGEYGNVSQGVTSVNGKTGVVVLTTTDIAEGSNLYFTTERAQDATGAMVDQTIVYDDVSNGLSRAAITGDITIAQGQNVASITAGAIVNADINAAAGIDATKIADGSVSNLEFQTLNGVTGAIQTQIDGKQSNIQFQDHGVNIGTNGRETVLNFTGLGATVTEGGGTVTLDVTTGGDVIGPASATDNAIARYDGVTGSYIQDSGATIDDLGNISATNLSGTNTGDQTTITGNAGTATALQNARLIGNVSFNGTANIVPETIQVVDSTDSSSFILMVDSATGALQPKTDAGISYNATTGNLSATGFSGPLTGNVTGNVSGNAGTVTTNANLTGDVTSVGNATSIATGVIVNADVNASAAIAVSKLAATTASRALVSDGSGFLAAATTTATEIGYVNGVTSAIQTQLNTKAPTASPTFTGTVTLPAGQVVNGVTLTTGGSATQYLNAAGSYVSIAGGGTVTSVSVVSANGFAGSVATATSTPAITLSTTITGLVKGNGTAISAATAGTDYSAGTSALATGILKSTTTTGALTIAVAGDFPTLNQNTTGSAATLTTPRAIGIAGSTGLTATGVNFNGSAAINPALTGTLIVANGGTGRATSTTAYGLIAAGTTATGAHQTLAAGATTTILVGGGASALPVWTTATGTGAPVRATSPTLVTPALGTPSSGTLTSCTGLPLTTGVTGTLPVANGGTGVTTSTGATNNVLSDSPTINQPNIVGVTTNSNAAVGSVGQLIESEILAGAAVAATSGANVNVTSISLTAGDWDVWGCVTTAPAAGTTTTVIAAWISTVSATLPTIPNKGGYGQQSATSPAAASNTIQAGKIRLSLSGTTTVYLSTVTVFAVNTMGVYGYIGARRVR